MSLQKLKIDGQIILAEIVSDTMAKIKEIPENPEYTYNELVLYDNNNNVTCSIKKSTSTARIMYGFETGKSGIINEKIEYHFDKHRLKTQSNIPGLMLVAFPIGDEDTLVRVANSCPEKIKICLNLDDNE